MKKTILATVMMLLVVMLAACAPSIDRAKADYCQALGEFAKAVVELRQIDQNSTVDELKDAQQAVSRAWDNLTGSAGDLAIIESLLLRLDAEDIERRLSTQGDLAARLAFIQNASGAVGR